MDLYTVATDLKGELGIVNTNRVLICDFSRKKNHNESEPLELGGAVYSRGE
jgi:hypothetical protein